MAETTKIQWCDHTFNPFRGCSEVHVGCDNCYARTLSKRNPKTLGVWGPQGTRVVAAESQWKAVERWNREAACDCYCRADLGERHLRSCPQSHRPRVFCASLADVFEDWDGPMVSALNWKIHIAPSGQWTSEPGSPVDDPGWRPLTMSDVRARLFRLIDACPHLDFLLVTKRPENVQKMWPTEDDGAAGRLAEAIFGRPGKLVKRRDNVWLLTSVSDQETADAAIPELLKCCDLVPVLGISAEPLLGPIHLAKYLLSDHDRAGMEPQYLAPLGGNSTAKIDWLILGGESGSDARPCNVGWIRNLVEQCEFPGTPVFVKQLGENVWTSSDRDEWPGGNGLPQSGPIRFSPDGFGNMAVLGLIDRKAGDPAEWPEDLRVRQFPEVAR